MKNIFIVGFLLLVTSVILFAENKKTITAVYIDSYLEIDGKLNEIEWGRCQPTSGFIQKDPIEGKEPDEDPLLYFLYNQKYLYVGARIPRKDISSIRSYVSRRDNVGNSERIIISIDTYNNKKTSYSFAITATGVRSDYYHSSDSEHDRDYNYNPIWNGKSNIDSLGWTAEMAIPFNQLRFNDEDELVWGINSNQWTPSKKEDLYWVMIPKNEAGWASKFGTLNGIKGIKSSKRVEITPYMSSGFDYSSSFKSENPYSNNLQSSGRFGTDFKMGIGPNSTFDATMNPDFGQVESDPAVINLTEFETYHDEKRQFFIEGNSLFSNTGNSFYYSRRIGAPPTYRPNAKYYSKVEYSRLMGAAKITGRTETGMSYGLMSCLTNSEYSEVFDDITLKKKNVEVAPFALYNIGRLMQEIDNNGSHFGVLFSAVNRKIDLDSPLNDYYNDGAYSGCIDWSKFIYGKKYNFSGNLGFSHITGTEGRLLKLQNETTQNFARPDADHLKIDSTLTSLTGIIASLSFAKNTGKHWLWSWSIYTETPGLNLNDFGKLMHSDEISSSGEIKYRETKPNQFLMNYYLSLSSNYKLNWAYEKMENPLFFNWGLTLFNKNSFNGGLHLWSKTLSDTRTKGGVMVASAPYMYAFLGMNGDYSRPYQWNVYLDATKSDYGRESIGISSSYEYNFMRYKLSLSFSYDYGKNPDQFVGESKTLYSRYIFGTLKQNTLSTGFRINYSINPDLTIECFMAPFIANGVYEVFGELKNRADFHYKKYGVDDNTSIEKSTDGKYHVTDNGSEFSFTANDFTLMSLRAAIVLRWEYLPGCELFAVWQFNGNDYLNYQKTINSEEYGSLFEINGVNSIVLKLNYKLFYD